MSSKLIENIASKRAEGCPGRFGCRGITAPLKEVYYPTFRPVYAKDKSKKKTGKTTAKGAGRVGTAVAGMRRGTTVDNQIRQLIRGESIRAKHAFTKHIERFLRKFGWTPVDVQVPVWSARYKLRTEVRLFF